MNKYLAAISPTHIYVVHATIEDGVGAFLRTYTSIPKFQALEKIPFDSFDEANEHLSQIENLQRIPEDQITEILGDYFEIRRIGVEYAFISDSQNFLKELAATRNDLFGQITQIDSSSIHDDKELQILAADSSEFAKTNLTVEIYPSWPDLSSKNVFLAFSNITGVGSRLLIVDINNCADMQKLADMGIKPVSWSPKHSSGIYFLDSNDRKFKAGQLASAFGFDACPIIKNCPKQKTVSDFKKAYEEKADVNFRNIIQNSETLGKNGHEQTVFEYKGLRYLKAGNGYLIEKAINAPSAFMSALDTTGNFNKQELKKCLIPIAQNIISGKPVSSADLNQYATVFFRKNELSDNELFNVREMLETVMYEAYALLYTAKGTAEEKFELAKSAYYSQPKRTLRKNSTIELGQYSTPIPIALLAQEIILSSNIQNLPITVLEPTIGNGGLVSILSRHMNIKVSGLEIDPQRINNLRGVKTQIGDALQTDFMTLNDNKTFDAVISNPPFGALEEKILYKDQLAIRRLDYLIALRALDARKDNGISVFILGGDGRFSDGSIEGGSKYFYNYLYNHYQIHGLIELDSSLYERNGAVTNVRMLVVGNRYPVPLDENSFTAPKKVEVVKNFDDLRIWQRNLVADIHNPIFDFSDVNPDNTLMDFLNTEPSEQITHITDSFEPNQEKQDGLNLEFDLFGFDEFNNKLNIDENTKTEDGITETFTETPIVDGIHVNAPDNSAVTDKINAEIYIKTIKERKENELQSPYLPMSKINEATAMIPINMAASTYAAFERVTEQYPDIDQYVCDKLAYDSKEKLGSLFSAEQIDALALAIFSHEELGRSMINADQTGLGKGRFMAGLIRYCAIQGMTPVFLTYKPSLLSDIFRDVADIESLDLFKNVFTVNNVKITDFYDTNKPLFKAMKAAEHKKIIQDGELPDNTDLVLATYSQFSQRLSRSAKAQFLEKIAAKGKTFFLLDESHIAAGESNIHTNIAAALDVSSGAVFSSATALKNTKSFKLYKSIFPPSINPDTLPEIFRVGGESLQEAVSNCLAADGVLICRQHDLSDLEIRTIDPDEEFIQRNREISDKVAEILTMMSTLSGDVKSRTVKMNDDFQADYDALPDSIKQSGSGRMQASSMNFGSRLYATTRQLLLGLQVEQTIDLAIDDLENNIKTVIGVENTGESLLNSLINTKIFNQEDNLYYDQLSAQDSKTLSDSQKEELARLNNLRSERLQELFFEEVPQFRDYLKLVLSRIRNIYVRNAYGVGHFETIKDKSYLDLEDRIKESIDKLTEDIPLIPIDVIRQSLKERGYSMAEVSGRNIYLEKTEHPEGNGKPAVWMVRQMPSEKEATKTINGFQDGKFDAITITKTGSTGFSMHANPLFRDTRQRDFIALQKAANITDFLQWIGRVNRKGQVISPKISSLNAGLPVELRLTMMHNAKLRKLSANVTSNRENSNIENEEVDFLNKVGDELALNFLMVNEELAERIDVKLPKDADDLPKQENYYINRLMSRLVLLPVEEQEGIISTLSMMFSEKIAQLDAQGINPFKVEVFDWKAKEVESFNIESFTGIDTGSYFDVPLKVSSLEFDIHRKPITFDKVDEMVERYIEEHHSGQEFNDYLPKINVELFRANREAKLRAVGEYIEKAVLIRAYNQLPKSGREEVCSYTDLPDKVTVWKQDGKYARQTETVEQAAVAADFGKCDVGSYLYVLNKLGEVKIARVVGLTLPDNSAELSHLARTGLQVVIAGDDKVSKFNLAQLHNHSVALDGLGIERMLKNEAKAAELFSKEIENSDTAVKKRVQVLENNLFKSIEMATENRMGTPILYTDENGIRKRAVLLKPEFTVGKLKELPVKLSMEMASRYIGECLYRISHGMTNQEFSGSAVFNSRMTSESKVGLSIELRLDSTGGIRFLVNDVKSKPSKALLRDPEIFVGHGHKNERAQGLGLEPIGRHDSLSCTLQPEQVEVLLEIINRNHGISGMYLLNAEDAVLKTLKHDRKSDCDYGSGL